MHTTDIQYTLPAEKIAQHPPKIRGDAKLLVLHKDTGEIEHRQYKDLPEYLNENDLIIRNNTKVIPARLYAKKENGSEIEILLLEKHLNTPYSLNPPFTAEAIYKGKLTPGETLTCHGEKLTVNETTNGGTVHIKSACNLYELAQEYGKAPIPPYLKRSATAQDKERYQTVFAHDPGSIAAPTASLNFTEKLGRKLQSNGIQIAELTLHVGRGTFLPVKTENLKDHTMHKEFYTIPSKTISAIRKIKSSRLNKVIALGTTVTRALEHASSDTLNLNERTKKQSISNEADIFIYPGYKFQIIDVLLTNFHAPRSTVLMLTSAFAGKENLLNAYDQALNNDYKFLSYGDSMLIL